MLRSVPPSVEECPAERRKLRRAEPAASGRRSRAFATRKPPASPWQREGKRPRASTRYETVFTRRSTKLRALMLYRQASRQLQRVVGRPLPICSSERFPDVHLLADWVEAGRHHSRPQRDPAIVRRKVRLDSSQVGPRQPASRDLRRRTVPDVRPSWNTNDREVAAKQHQLFSCSPSVLHIPPLSMPRGFHTRRCR
jgi:hypothetical protein